MALIARAKREQAESTTLDSDIEEIVMEVAEKEGDDLSREEAEEWVEERSQELDSRLETARDEAKEKLMSPFYQRIAQDFSNHYINIRKHFSNIPRDESLGEFRHVGGLLAECLSVEMKNNMDYISSDEDLVDDSIRENADAIIEKCESRIDELNDGWTKRQIKRFCR